MTTAARPLSFFESLLNLATERTYSSVIYCWASGTGHVDVDQVRSAMKVLHDRHPLLRGRIEGEPGAYQFQIDVPFDRIPLHEIDLADGEDINSVIEPLMDVHFPSQERTWGARFVRAGTSDRWWLVLEIHHAISDGRSAYSLLNQCGELLGAIVSNQTVNPDPLDLPLPIEQQLQPPGTMDRWNNAFELWSKRIGEICHWPLDGNATYEDRHCHNTYTVHDPDFSRRLIDGCHAAGTTVQGAFTSAVARGTAAFIDHAIDIDTLTPVDLRGHASDTIDAREIACKITCLDTGSFNVTSESDPWEIARAYTTALQKQIAAQVFPPLEFTSGNLLDGLEGFLDTEGRFAHGFCLTNAGRLPMDGDYGPIQFEGVDITAAVRYGGMPILHSVNSFRDEIRCTYTWTEPLLTRSHALELTAAVESHLKSMIE